MARNQPETTDKKAEIIAVAQKWFGMYGFKKTSMSDIAGELTISKGLLYYYFPDKDNLYTAVVEKEIEAFRDELEERLPQMDGATARLHEYVRLRLHYFVSMLNLSRLRYEEMQQMTPALCETIQSLRAWEKQTILNILKSGMEHSGYLIDDPEETATLFFDLIRGLRLTMVKDRQLFYLDQQDYSELLKKAEYLVDLFTRGLMNPHKAL